jgi:hypothetical protein
MISFFMVSTKERLLFCCSLALLFGPEDGEVGSSETHVNSCQITLLHIPENDIHIICKLIEFRINVKQR